MGLSREAAPESVQWFVSLAKGQLTTGLGEDPAKLERSNLVRIERDRAVVLGALTQRGSSEAAPLSERSGSSVQNLSERATNTSRASADS